MELPIESSLDELVRAGSLLTKDLNIKTLITILVEQALDITRSSLSCLYLYTKPGNKNSDLRLCHKRGKYQVSIKISAMSELIDFLNDCKEAVILTERKKSPFSDILLHSEMQSGIAIPLLTNKEMHGVLFLNSLTDNFYNRKRLSFLDSFTKFAGGLLHNAILYSELKEYLKKIEELKLYQENIFSSMTNLLITTDNEGHIEYYNRAAEERFGVSNVHKGRPIHEVFTNSIDKNILKLVKASSDQPKEIAGIEGIFHTPHEDIDFSMNMSPLKGKWGRYQGNTLLFTDQSKERELQEQMQLVVEERRVIKNMFSTYLSKEIVQKLMEAPNLVKPGGDKKEATLFFADIRGYTSFSEGKDPEYIIGILNEFFSKAVELVIEHQGYIDKFIGDCIMAAWGVPLWTAKEDAIHAVSCALELQEHVSSESREFFKGEASGLTIGIGMHTGALVAGNLGSTRRMNYTVVGDTVNIAARLENVAGPGEIIITKNTYDYLGDLFIVEKKKSVSLKGMKNPIPIYRVIGRAS